MMFKVCFGLVSLAMYASILAKFYVIYKQLGSYRVRPYMIGIKTTLVVMIGISAILLGIQIRLENGKFQQLQKVKYTDVRNPNVIVNET